jgi:hypothetical protein
MRDENDRDRDHRARRRAREDILLRFKELSWQDQFKTYEVIQGYFIHSGPGAEAWREVKQRGECVEAVQTVARHLGLPEGEAPGVEDYESGRKELGLTLSASTIVRRWAAWREVVKAARGEQVAMTARQRAQYRAAIRRKHKGEEWLEGVREWLREGGPSACKADYNAWAQERNEKKPRLTPVASAESIDEALVLSWSTVVRVAKRELSIADAQAQELKRLERENGEFVTVRAIALMHGVTTPQANRVVAGDAFPPHAFKLYRMRIWRLSDVRAHLANEPFPSREPEELQGQVMTATEVRHLLGLSRMEMIAAVERTQMTPPRPARIPRPAGRVGSFHYWFRLAVEAWCEQQGANA